MIRRLLALSVGVCCLAHPAAGQSSLQVPIQFDFLNPSARSLALGSAFVGLADDATAALVNPAGLIQLTRKELSIEGRFRHLKQPFLVGGRLSGPTTGKGQDTIPGPQFETIADSGVGASFVSFVYPRGRFRAAIFRNELVRVEQEFTSRGVFQNQGFDVRDTAFTGLRTLNVDTYGASAAVQAGRVSLGAGVLVHRFSLGFEFERYVHTGGDLYGVPDPNLSVFHFSQEGKDTAIGAVVGVLVPVSSAKVGIAYKRAPRFDYSSFSGGLVGSQQRTFSEFKVPDTLAVGFSAAPTINFLITTEYTRVFHSQLRADYVDVLVNQGESRTRADRFSIDDAGEMHVGVEYLIPKARRPGIRAGVWFESDHSVHFVPTPANDLLDERIDASLSSGRDLWHYTAGGRFALHPRVDFSAGVDYSARSTIVSVSTIIGF
jgi:long-subunit fatty acid transport protein